MEAVSLKQFLASVKDVLEASFPFRYGVTAEIARFSVNPNSGHCYLDLVDKEGESVVAKAGGVIWKSRLSEIRARFRNATGQELKEGLKVLLVAEVNYHELYGFKLNILDIDPSYTLGEFALHRKKIIERLTKEGLLEANKALPFPLVPQRLAVISSESAAGYEDFVNTLENNPYGYRMHVTLFPSYMQGEQAEQSILASMQKCSETADDYDALVIIRGGGDQVDLHCFDNYNLGRAIALFPLPVLTGIGHRRDETVAEVVAYKGMISPTAVAEFIVDRMRSFEEILNDLSKQAAGSTEKILAELHNNLNMSGKQLQSFANFFLQQRKHNLRALLSDFRNNATKNIAGKEYFIKQMPSRLSASFGSCLKTHLNILERRQDKIEMMNPAYILKKGYSITCLNGRTVKNAQTLSKGDRLTTKFYKGEVESVVDKDAKGNDSQSSLFPSAREKS